MKKILAMALAVGLMLSLSTGAAAAESGYIHVLRCNPGLTVTGNSAACSLTVTTQSGSGKVTATMKLVRVNSDGSYTSIQSWSYGTKTGSFTANETCTSYLITSGYTYRMIYQATVSGVGGSPPAPLSNRLASSII